MKLLKTRLLPAALSALLLGLLYRQLPAGALMGLLAGMSPAWLLTAAGLYGAVNVLRAIRFGLLLPALEAPVGHFVPLAFAVSLLNNVLPMRGGEAGFVLLAKTHYQASIAEATAALGLARLFDYLAVGALFVPLAWLSLSQLPKHTDWPWQGTEAGAILWAVIGLVLLLGLLTLSLPWLGGCALAVLRRLLSLLGLRETPPGRRVLSFAERTVTAVAALRKPATYLRLLGLSLLQWLILFAWLYAFVCGLGYRESFRLFVVGATFAVLSKALPVPTLGSMGVAETGWALGFTLAGWTPTDAIASGLAVTVLTVALSAVFGLPSLWWLGSPRQGPGSGSTL